jgi:homopolymeric O-antigen transport system ATP-binding protein
MSSVAVHAEGLGKQFRIGQLKRGRKTLGEVTAEVVLAPFRRLRRMATGDSGGASDLNDTIWALRDVGFEVKHGEVVGIIGRNGAGKSTLLKILSRITEPTSGFADVHGHVASLLEVGTGFHQELTGRENIYLNGSILGMRKTEIDRKFDEIVAFADVERFLDTPVKHYSSGMQTRLGFAVAAHLDPEILLIDEVLAVGDANFQRKCLNKMHDVSQQGRTVVFISHNMTAVARLCPRTILLDHGHVVCDGPSHEVVSKYLSSASVTAATREWNDPGRAPGGAVARLRAIRVRGEDGEVQQTFDIRGPIAIEMDYEILTAGRAVLPFHHVFAQDGIQLFSTHDIDPEWVRRPRLPGRYRSTAIVPGNFLNEGTHSVCSGLLSVEPTSLQCFERDVVTFHIVDSPDDDTARGVWHRPMLGAVRPALRWTTTILPDAVEASPFPLEKASKR